MKATQSFEAVHSHERFRLTARAGESWLGNSYVELLVEDTESGAAIRLKRHELMPLLGAVNEALKAVEDALAGLPTDPVERAARCVPVSSKYHGLQQGKILKAYAQELADLRARYVRQFDDDTTRINNPEAPKPAR
jgi:hypothetical protein